MAYKILEKKELGESGALFEMVLHTPLIARKAHAGNFKEGRREDRGRLYARGRRHCGPAKSLFEP